MAPRRPTLSVCASRVASCGCLRLIRLYGADEGGLALVGTRVGEHRKQPARRVQCADVTLDLLAGLGVRLFAELVEAQLQRLEVGFAGRSTCTSPLRFSAWSAASTSWSAGTRPSRPVEYHTPLSPWLAQSVPLYLVPSGSTMLSWKPAEGLRDEEEFGLRIVRHA